MRISTQMIFNGGSDRITGLQAKLDRVAQQVSTGRAVLTPADNPVLAAQSLSIREDEARLSQFGLNRNQAKNTLGAVDSALTGVSDTLNGIQEQVVTAGNGALSTDQMGIIGNALRSQLEQLVGLMNSTDGAGHQLFSGMATDTQAFQASTGYSYQGSAEEQLVPVAEGRSLSVSEPASQLLVNSNGQNLLQALNATISQLNNPNANRADLQAALQSLNGLLGQTQSAVANRQASVGVRLQELDRIDQLSADRSLQLASKRSQLEDLDYNQALSDLARQQLALQAAQKSFQMVSSLSLFNYL